MGKHGRLKAGRPPYQPTPELARQVMAMTGYGIKHEDIATVLNIDRKTLYRYYRRELDTGAIEANSRVAQALFKSAVVNENVTAQIWWTKARMGWKGQYGDDNAAQPLQVDFRWADAPNTNVSTNTNVDTTIDASVVIDGVVADATDEQLTIVWNNGEAE